MRPTVVVEQTIKVGEKIVIEGPSPSTDFAVVFEDDGETGYFYGLDESCQSDPIVDALLLVPRLPADSWLTNQMATSQ